MARQAAFRSRQIFASDVFDRSPSVSVPGQPPPTECDAFSSGARRISSCSWSHEAAPAKPEDLSLRVLVPAFMISELKRAFEIDFLLFLPVVVSLPIKLIFFVLVDGWSLVAGGPGAELRDVKSLRRRTSPKSCLGLARTPRSVGARQQPLTLLGPLGQSRRHSVDDGLVQAFFARAGAGLADDV